MDVRADIREGPDGRWTAVTDGSAGVRASGSTRERCIASLRRAVERLPGRTKGESVTIVAQTLPQLAGVAEAAEIMGWDKRRVITYIDRGSFPEPVETLASGRVWIRADVVAFAAEWRARQARRSRRARRR